MTQSDSVKITSPIIIGEVLFDCFPDGNSVLGGAPFNVAWHLQGFGIKPLMISAVGDDEHGKLVTDIMQTWGMRLDGIQVDKDHPTGQVTIAFNDGQPSYDIRQDQAYDNVEIEPVASLIEQSAHPMLYHGTLFKRTLNSRELVNGIIGKSVLPTFVDINLRAPWWSMDEVDCSLKSARWAKLNDEELMEITGNTANAISALEDYASQLRVKYELQLLIVTLGDKGVICITENESVVCPPVKAHVVDTVGAGDAFSAVTILGLINKWPVDIMLNRALKFAARICEQQGATANNPQLYEKYLTQW